MKGFHRKAKKPKYATLSMILVCAAALTVQFFGARKLRGSEQDGRIRHTKYQQTQKSENEELDLQNQTRQNEEVLFCGSDGRVTNSSSVSGNSTPPRGVTMQDQVSILLNQLEQSLLRQKIMDDLMSSSATNGVDSPSSTGTLFSGEVFRQFQGKRIFATMNSRRRTQQSSNSTHSSFRTRYMLSHSSLSKENTSTFSPTLPQDSLLTTSQFNATTANNIRNGRLEKHSQRRLSGQTTTIPLQSGKVLCANWCVVTTIFAPTEAVRRAAQISSDWCVVVVADTKTPTNYLDQANLTVSETARTHFLSVAWQQMLTGSVTEWSENTRTSTSSSSVAKFIKSIPYKHFARKNIGYLYAIAHGAQFIFDFDDDNLLTLDEENNWGSKVVRPPVVNFTHLSDVRVPILAKDVFNHHPLMGASQETSWARGFPLQSVLDETTHGAGIAYKTESMSMDRIGVMQICADGNPDIDAIHRLVKPLPMYFAASSSPSSPDSSGGGGAAADLRKPLFVPHHAFAPYNAQATVHTRQAMWAMLLPASVPGRVSDIWRGYFAQAIFRALDLSLVFMPSVVDQNRNEHNYLADMQAELDLYFKLDQLLEYLHDWNYHHSRTAAAATVPERMVDLWIGLYERGYIEASDVEAVQLWLHALVEIGYEFPQVKRVRHDNVVLMGQFNFANEMKSVLFWVQKWKEVFKHIDVYGPFDQCLQLRLKQSGVNVHYGKADAGYYSPMENLRSALLEHKNDGKKSIEGVLYLHDDAYLNISGLTTKNASAFPTQDIIASQMAGKPHQFSDFRTISSTDCREGCFTMKILRNGSFVRADGVLVDTQDKLNLKRWFWWRRCITNLQAVAVDPRSSVYRDSTDWDSFLVPSPGPSDFLFVPMKHADAYINASELLLEHNVFLECGVPTIVQMLRKVSNASVRTIPLCTSWGRADRGTDAMLAVCEEEASLNGMYHPFKISKGLDWWGDRFDHLVHNSHA